MNYIVVYYSFMGWSLLKLFGVTVFHIFCSASILTSSFLIYSFIYFCFLSSSFLFFWLLVCSGVCKCLDTLHCLTLHRQLSQNTSFWECVFWNSLFLSKHLTHRLFIPVNPSAVLIVLHLVHFLSSILLLHIAIVARSTFPSQNVQQHTRFGPLLEVEMSKKCTPLKREAHFQVKMYKTHHSRTTLGSSGVEKVHAAVARTTFPSQKCKSWEGTDHILTFPSQKCKKNDRFGPLVDVQMSKKCTLTNLTNLTNWTNSTN